MTVLKSPFKQLVTPLEGEKQLMKTDAPAITRRKETTHIGIYIETSGANACRLIVTDGYELIWTERNVAVSDAQAYKVTLQAADDFINSEEFAREYTFLAPSVPEPAQPQTAFPAYESELTRI